MFQNLLDLYIKVSEDIFTDHRNQKIPRGSGIFIQNLV